VKTSESITKIMQALIKAQHAIPAATLNKRNPFTESMYADLGEVISKARPVLEENKLALVQIPISAEGKIGLETIIMHDSGEWISETIFIEQAPEAKKSIAQVAGSTISYLRRYSMTSILGMYAEEDNDGNSGSSNGSGNGSSSSRSGRTTMKEKIDATKRGWMAYAKKVGLMENPKDEKEMAEFKKVMGDHIAKLADIKKVADLNKLEKEGKEAMDTWRDTVVQ